jgi:hypothetical protein
MCCDSSPAVDDDDDDDKHDHDNVVCSSFATALHTVQIQTHQESHHTSSSNVVNEPHVTCKEVASYYLRDDDPAAASPSMICVGYSSCFGWEAVVLLDTSTIPLSQLQLDPAGATATATTAAPAAAPPNNSNSSVAPSNLMSDDVSIATAVTSSVMAAAAATHEASASKRGGGGGGGGVDTGVGGGGGPRPRRTVSSSEISVPESLAASDFDESTTMNINHSNSNNNNNNNIHSSGICAMLILRSLVVQGGDNNSNGNDDYHPNKCYSTHLSFRPLAPVVRLVGAPQHPPTNCQQTQETKTENSPIVWLGSADTSKLYCFTLGEKVVFADADGGSTTYGDDVLQTRMDLVPVALSDPAFNVESPVMALDCLNIYHNHEDKDNDIGESEENATTERSMISSSTSDNSGCCCYCLAISCQDGTIRFISFFLTKAISSNIGPVDGGVVVGAFENVQATTFIIDGPSICIHLSCSSHRWWHESNDDRAVYATIGSLCGYVTVMYTRDIFGKVLASEAPSSNDDITKNDSISWEGPFIMAEGFWNQHLEAEDSVLAVHDIGMNGMVALGTHGGRCFLYQAVNKSSSSITSSQQHSSINSSHDMCDTGDDAYGEHVLYRRLWECQLPYSIHGICHVPSCNSSSSSDNNIRNVPLSLLVTTRKSVHLFTQQTPKIVYDASLAKKRIDALLQQVLHRQKEDTEHVPDSASTTMAAASTTRLVPTEKMECGESSSSNKNNNSITIHTKSENVLLGNYMDAVR